LKCPTTFGKVLDPAADKALMTAAFVALTFIGNVPLWLAAVVIGRDVLIGVAVGVTLLMRVKLDTTPLFIGKLTTALQITYLAAHLAALAFAFSLGKAVPYDAYILAGVTLLSGAGYLWRGLMAVIAGRRA
jgi:cardiolipin synthase